MILTRKYRAQSSLLFVVAKAGYRTFSCKLAKNRASSKEKRISKVGSPQYGSAKDGPLLWDSQVSVSVSKSPRVLRYCGRMERKVGARWKTPNAWGPTKWLFAGAEKNIGNASLGKRHLPRGQWL